MGFDPKPAHFELAFGAALVLGTLATGVGSALSPAGRPDLDRPVWGNVGGGELVRLARAAASEDRPSIYEAVEERPERVFFV